MKWNNPKIISALTIVAVGLLSVIQVSCDTTVSPQVDHSGTPQIEGVRYVSPDSSKNVKEIGPGAVVALQGKNMDATANVYFNGYEASFNPTLASDTTLVVTVPSDIPFGEMDPEAETFNTIRVSNSNGESVLEFPVVPPAPQVNSISNEYADPGQQMTIYGNYLYLVSSITFPNDIEATEYSAAANGTSLTVTVPEQAESGDIRISTSGGSTVTPPGFGFRLSEGMVCNFDDVNTYSWGAAAVTSDASLFPGSDGTYAQMTGSEIGSQDWAWYNGTRSVNLSESTVIDPSNLDEPVGNFALKFEINVKSTIENGLLLIREDGNWEYTFRYEPWDDGGAFSTDGWQTVTAPLTEFRTKANGTDGTGSSAPSLSALTSSSGNSAFGFMFVNDSDVTIPNVNIAVDNIRVVRIAN